MAKITNHLKINRSCQVWEPVSIFVAFLYFQAYHVNTEKPVNKNRFSFKMAKTYHVTQCKCSGFFRRQIEMHDGKRTENDREKHYREADSIYECDIWTKDPRANIHIIPNPRVQTDVTFTEIRTSH
jgi:hypothetical protein